MNWDAIGAIGESIGALGVIASLVYLGVQIRHGSQQTELNTKSVKSTAHQQLIDHHTHLNLQLVSQQGLFEILRKAEQMGLDDLEAIEFNKWEIFIASSLRSFLNGFYLYQEGLISDEQWENFFSSLESLARRASFQQWWSGEKTSRRFPKEFVRIVDRTINIEQSP